jgi:hypothetical protein
MYYNGWQLLQAYRVEATATEPESSGNATAPGQECLRWQETTK